MLKWAVKSKMAVFCHCQEPSDAAISRATEEPCWTWICTEVARTRICHSRLDRESGMNGGSRTIDSEPRNTRTKNDLPQRTPRTQGSLWRLRNRRSPRRQESKENHDENAFELWRVPRPVRLCSRPAANRRNSLLSSYVTPQTGR